MTRVFAADKRWRAALHIQESTVKWELPSAHSALRPVEWAFMGQKIFYHRRNQLMRLAFGLIRCGPFRIHQGVQGHGRIRPVRGRGSRSGVGTSPFCGEAPMLVDRTSPERRMRASGSTGAGRDVAPDEFNRAVPISDFLTLRVEDRRHVMVWP